MILPDTTTNEATGVTSTSANLIGAVNAAGGSKVTECQFQYVTDEAYQQTGYSNLESGGAAPCSPLPPYSGETEVPVSAEVRSAFHMTYHFRVIAANASGKTQGKDLTFATFPAVSISALTPNPIKATTVTLHSKVNPNGNGEVTDCRFEYLSEVAFNENGGNYSGAQAAPCTPSIPYAGEQEVSATVGDLTAATSYHWRLVATDSAGTTLGSDHTVATVPAVSNLLTTPATALVPGSATLNASYTGEEANDTYYYFEYGTSTAYGQTSALPPGVDNGSSGGNQEISAAVSNLLPYTLYHYRIVATDEFGTTVGPDQTVLTDPPNLPDVDGTTASSVKPDSATLEAVINSGFGPTIARFEYGTTPQYGSRTFPTEPIGFDGANHPASTEISDLVDPRRRLTTSAWWQLTSPAQSTVPISLPDSGSPDNFCNVGRRDIPNYGYSRRADKGWF